MKLKKTMTCCLMGNSICFKYSTKILPKVSNFMFCFFISLAMDSLGSQVGFSLVSASKQGSLRAIPRFCGPITEKNGYG